MAKCFIASPYCYFLLPILALQLYGASHAAAAPLPPPPPAVFVFGDSTADVGTNNFIDTVIRANIPRYGVDFPNSEHTGRFTNGFNLIDEIVMLMGYERSPLPFLNLTHGNRSFFEKTIQTGVNFASGAAGTLDDTNTQSLHFGSDRSENIITLSEQIRQFATVRGNITKLRGTAKTSELLSESLFIFSIGSNDIFAFDRILWNNQSFVEFTADYISSFANHIQNVYNMGARKFGFIGIPLLGCCPAERLFTNDGSCVERLNDYAKTINAQFESLVKKLSSDLKEMKYSIGNSYQMNLEILENPGSFRIRETKKACCGAGKFNAKLACIGNLATLCSNRDEYLFFDYFHPTQAVCKLAASALYGGPKKYVAPINFSQLLAQA